MVVVAGHTLFKKYQKKIQDLDTFQSTKQEIINKINQVLDEKVEQEKQREIFKEELILRIRSYLSDLPISKYTLDYKDIVSGSSKSKYEIIGIKIYDNPLRTLKDKILDLNKKDVKIWRDIKVSNVYYDEISEWEINDILKFHNSLEKTMLFIGEKYGYKPQPQPQPQPSQPHWEQGGQLDQDCKPCKT